MRIYTILCGLENYHDNFIDFAQELNALFRRGLLDVLMIYNATNV